MFFLVSKVYFKVTFVFPLLLFFHCMEDDENGQSGFNSRDNTAHRDQSGGRREASANQRNYNDRQRDYGNNRSDYSNTPRGNYSHQRGFGGNRDYVNRGGISQYREDGNRRGNASGGSGGRLTSVYSNSSTGRMNDYNYGRFDRDGRHPGGGNAQQGFRQGQRDSREDRRDRSPNRGEPVRGYGGGKGPRITSAVIRGVHERSSSSESSGSDD